MVDTRKQIHLNNFDYSDSSYIYFITICTANKQSHFVHKPIAESIVKALMHRKSIGVIKLYSFCLMPNHLHILLSLAADYKKDLKAFMSAFKRYTSKLASDSFNISPLWQVNFYDHIVRKEESLIQIADYILNNPVRKGIVSKWSDYPYARLVDDLPV